MRLSICVLTLSMVAAFVLLSFRSASFSLMSSLLF